MVYTLPTGNETIAGLYAWASTTTGGVSSYGILMIIFCVVFFGTMRFGATSHHATLLGLTATTLIGGALMVMGATSGIVVSILAAALAIAYFYNSQS